jgi:hypothetical protein
VTLLRLKAYLIRPVGDQGSRVGLGVPGSELGSLHASELARETVHERSLLLLVVLIRTALTIGLFMRSA